MGQRSVAVICTVLNEEGSIASLLDSLVAQTRRPDEVIVVDGGSTDRTVEIINAYARQRLPLRVLQVAGSNISQGRNRAIGEATSDVIAATDAGVRLAPRWLAELMDAFERDEEPAEFAAGFFEPDDGSTFELAMGATVLPCLKEIKPETFLPSSRSVAFTRAAWSKVGGYPEWLDYSEDLVFDFAMRREGYATHFAPDAVAYFRPRGSLPAFFRQYFRYARGDGKAGLWPRRHALRYSTYACGSLALLLGFWYKVIWLMLCLAAAVYLYRPYRRLAPRLAGLPPSERVRAVFLVPIIRLVGDLAKMAGYPSGLLWRLREGKRLAGR